MLKANRMKAGTAESTEDPPMCQEETHPKIPPKAIQNAPAMRVGAEVRVPKTLR